MARGAVALALQAPAPTLPTCQLFAWDPGRTLAALFPGSYEAFIAPCGIDGLARIEGDHLHVLAVVSAGRGSFRRFVQLAKLEFSEITVWEIWSPVVRDALLRYDFEATRGCDNTGKPIAGLTWSRTRQAEIDSWRERPARARWTPMSEREIAAAQATTARALEMVAPHRSSH